MDKQRQSRTVHLTNREMRSFRNLMLHGSFQLLYGVVKYIPIPFADYLRFMVIRGFSKNFRATYISDGVQIWFPWRVSAGKGTCLNQGVIVDGTSKVCIGENVLIAAYATINSADHGFSNPNIAMVDQGFNVADVEIGNDVWIGTGATILKGVTIGDGAVIAANAVITRDVEPYAIVAGNPGRVIGSRQNNHN